MNKFVKMQMLRNSRDSYTPENRFRDRDGREHYDDYRYENRTNYDYRDNRTYSRSDWDYRSDRDQDGQKRVIGFAGTDMRYEAPERMNEMEHRTSEKQRGYSHSESQPVMSLQMAEEWMSNLKNEDGTVGPHWTLDQVKSLVNQRGIDVDPIKMWVAMNAEYSDRYKVNSKHGVDNIGFYVDSALASWIRDKDAVDDKEAAYYTYIVKR